MTCIIFRHHLCNQWQSALGNTNIQTISEHRKAVLRWKQAQRITSWWLREPAKFKECLSPSIHKSFHCLYRLLPCCMSWSSLFAFFREGHLSVVWWLVVTANRIGFSSEGGLLVQVWRVSSRWVWWGIVRDRWCLVRWGVIWSRFCKTLSKLSKALAKSHYGKKGDHTLCEEITNLFTSLFSLFFFFFYIIIELVLVF